MLDKTALQIAIEALKEIRDNGLNVEDVECAVEALDKIYSLDDN